MTFRPFLREGSRCMRKTLTEGRNFFWRMGQVTRIFDNQREILNR